MLEQLAKEKNMTPLDIAHYCGIEKSLIYKIMKGTRLPGSLALVRSMAECLRLTSDETRLLIEAYRMTVVGREAYSRRMAVLDFIRYPLNVKENPVPSGMDRLIPEEISDSSDMRTLKSENAIIYSIMHELFRESQNGEKAQAYLITNHFKHDVFNIIEMTLFENRNLKLNHLLTFRTSFYTPGDEKNYNFELLKGILSLRSASSSYTAEYQYYSHAGMKEPLIPFANYLITSSCVIVFSNNADHGFISRSPELREMYMDFYRKAEREGRPAFSSDFGFISHVETINRKTPGERENTIVYCDYPVMHLFLSPEIIRRSAVKISGIEEKEIKELESYTNHGMASLISRTVTMVFSYDGLRRFMERGDLALTMYNAFPALDMRGRTETLKRLLVNINNIDLVMLKEPLAFENTDMVLEMSYKKVYLRFSTWIKETVSMEITEPGLCNAFMDFMLTLKDGDDFAYSKDESVAIIKEILAEYEEKNEMPG